MFKKIAYLVLICLTVTAVGCETLPRKFIRKKKEPKHVSAVMFTDEGGSQKSFSNEYYYKMHYTLWKTWHDDMILNLTGNAKKLTRCTDEAYSHLEQMQAYLKPEKGAELKTSLDELSKYRARIKSQSLSRSEAATFKSDLDRIRRQVVNNYYYDKVKEDVLADVVEL
jgi:hypothetical protein